MRVFFTGGSGKAGKKAGKAASAVANVKLHELIPAKLEFLKRLYTNRLLLEKTVAALLGDLMRETHGGAMT